MGAFHTLDIYLVRHGVTKWNVDKRYLGHTDIPLLLVERNKLNPLREVLKNIMFDYCYSSDLKRCVETFHYIQPQKHVCVDARLRELNFGNWEGFTYETLKDDSSYQEWLSDSVKKAPPNGESLSQLNDRITDFLSDLQSIKFTSLDKKILIITHGGVIRSLFQMFGLAKSIWEVNVEHAKAYRLTLQEIRGEWVCSSLSVEPIQESEI